MATVGSVTGAVVARLDTHLELKTALSGGIWATKVPEDYPLPFAVVKDLGDELGTGGLSTGTDYVEQPRIAVWCFADTDSKAEEYAVLVDEALDQQPLSFADDSIHLGTLKTGPRLDGEEWKSPQGKSVFRAERNFLTWIQRTR